MAAGAGRNEHELIVDRVFASPRELVFAAWTEPERFARWFAPRGAEIVVHELDARPGGAMHFTHRFAGGDEVHVRGTFREVVAPSRVVFTSVLAGGLPPGIPDLPRDALLTTTVIFEEDGGATRLRLHQVLSYGGAANETVRRERTEARAGWDEMLDRLAEHVEPGGDR